MTSGILRRLISERKTYREEELEEWSSEPAPPRFTSFNRSMRLPSNDWKWRAQRCSTWETDFILFAWVNLRMGNYKAWLLMPSGAGLALLARLEDHASHAGLHAHSACGDIIPIPNNQSFNLCPDGTKLKRIPAANSSRRTVQGVSLTKFWFIACQTFKIDEEPEPQGSFSYERGEA